MTTKLSRIEQLKAKLNKEKEKKESGGGNFGNSEIYPFWQMKVGESARVRILPDKNEDNDYIFFIDKLEHKIGINGEDKRIPCRAMYGEECPICNLSRKYYKEEGKTSKDGKYFYRNKTSLVRVLVVEDPLEPNDKGETYEGKVLNTQFGYQLMEKIKEQISNDDLGDFTDLDEGYDFIIKKTPQGEYGTYAVGSGFARRPSAVDAELRDSVELIDLKTLLPADFGFEKVENMLSAHLTGEDYEDDSTPAQSKKSEKAEPKKSEAKPTPVKEDKAPDSEKETRSSKTSAVNEEKEEEVEAEAESTSEDDDGDDIIARLRARKAKAAAAKK
ncbi:single-stranded DNA binding protein [Xanthomonas phage Xoo-sp13]|nr:single-stranded DNA binding protein [Xanthomonas phage Xoo-sp13]